MASSIPNPLDGLHNVFDTAGGFNVREMFPTIMTIDPIDVVTPDVSNSIQILYSVRKLNDKLGIIKDEFNSEVFKQLYWDEITRDFIITNNSITINSEEFIYSIGSSSIITLGSLSNLYSDFNYTVKQYFGDGLGFGEFFNYTEVSNIDNGVFNAASFINLIRERTFDMVGRSATALEGSFTLNQVNENLTNAVIYNIFDNRCIHTENGEIHKKMTDGFLEGDLLYIQNGIRVTLTVDIADISQLMEEYIHSCLENEGKENVDLVDNANSSINDRLSYTDTVHNVIKTTTITKTNITQTFQVPILLVLTNTDTFVIEKYGYDWSNTTTGKNDYVTGIPLGDRKWLSISLSANGQYQSAVDKLGYIFISDNFGRRWKTTKKIAGINEDELNISTNNAVAISMTGKYQVACDGESIYVSTDYGETWTNKKTIMNNKVLVCISLNGQYISVISAGDTLYQSSDYGETWRAIDDAAINSALYENQLNAIYNSLSIFQYAGITMSYDGKYQTLTCEDIYISSDYGVNWSRSSLYVIDRNSISEGLIYEVDEDWSDRNWSGVSMSSDGKIQTAVNNGSDIFVSSDYGETWYEVYDTAENIIDKNWTGVSISANGRFQTAIDGNGTVHVSTNAGVDWKDTPSGIIPIPTLVPPVVDINPMFPSPYPYSSPVDMRGLTLQAVSVSANGQYQSIAVYGGGIYTSNLL